MAALEDRRDAQVDLEHQYYEDSGLADEHAKAALAFQAELLAAVHAATQPQQAVLAGTQPAADDMIRAGAPKGHPLTLKGGDGPGMNPIAHAIMSHGAFRNPGDLPVLEYCTGIFAEPSAAPAVEPQAPTGVRVTLTFAQNPYFTNERISRTFGVGTSPTDDLNIVSADEGTAIDWAAGKDATVRIVKKTVRGAAPTARKMPVMSLFRLFTKDGFAAFGEDMSEALLNTAKPLISIAAFTVHAATGTRKLHTDEGVEGDE